jgi:hypothetical protein
MVLRGASPGLVPEEGLMGKSRFRPLRALWLAGFAVQGIVLIVLFVRWAGSGQSQPPSLLIPFALGSLGVLAGVGSRAVVRLVAWVPSWCALGYVVLELVRLQQRLDRGLPGMYLLVFVGVTLLAAASLWQLSAARRP